MNKRNALEAGRRMVIAVLLTALSCAIAYAGNTWEDRQGRFALDLPEGYELKSESRNAFYTFGDTNPVGNICLTYGTEYSNVDEAFAPLVEGIVNYGFGAPPSDSITRLTIHGYPARWTEYRTTSEFDGREVEFVVFVGAVFSPDAGGTGFVTYSLPDGSGTHAEAARRSFESIVVRSVAPPAR